MATVAERSSMIFPKLDDIDVVPAGWCLMPFSHHNNRFNISDVKFQKEIISEHSAVAIAIANNASFILIYQFMEGGSPQ